ncbi:MAG: glucose-6-phosphate dehydrogenase assembly protein OpcA [Candidatus Limnocylindrales bacterium]
MAGGSGVAVADRPGTPGEPTLRWASRAHSIAEIEQELGKIWAVPKLTAVVEGVEERHVAARTSVMNLVVVARRDELGEHAAAVIRQLTGRHPSRTLILTSADPEGRSWLDADIQAFCVLPRVDAAETCAEEIHIRAGGAAGRHLEAIVAPLLIHDLPVTLWWPSEIPFGSGAARDLLAMADRLVVDGSSWTGDGLARLGELAAAMDRDRLAVNDFALIRQSRWREAIASVFDLPEFTPYLRSIRRISLTYGTHDETGAPGSTNVVKPVYHVAWLASRLGMTVERPLGPVDGPRAATRASGRLGVRTAAGSSPALHRGLVASLRTQRSDVAVVIRPVLSAMPAGTTLRVELLAERRGSELRADVTAEAETVHVRVWLDGVAALERSFLAARRTEVDLLGDAIEAGGRDPAIARDTIRMAARLAGG